jgi:hypothetical protein
LLTPVAGSGGLVHRASDLAGAAAGGADRLLPVARELRPLLPGLRRGSTIAVLPPAGSLVLALLAAASAAGCWVAVVGMPGLGVLAAAQAGVDLDRLALVPGPGPEWPTVVATLLDGVDVVVVAPSYPVTARVASRLAARARLRGSVLMPYGRWDGADLTLTADRGVWSGLGAGHGRLRCRESTVTVRGRGAASWPRQVRVRLPDSTGRLAPAPPTPAPAAALPAPASVARLPHRVAGRLDRDAA